MSQNDFGFWNESSHEDSPKTPKPSKQVEKGTPPDFPHKITAEWVREQLPKKVWDTVKRNGGQCSPETIHCMADIARRTPSKRSISIRAGLHPKTWQRWEALAEQGEQPYLLWYQCMALSLSELEEEMLDNIRGAAVSDWKAATWMLSKINKEEFAEQKGGGDSSSTSIEIKNDKNSAKVTINTLTREDTEKIGAIFQQIGAFQPQELESGEVVDGEVVEEEGE